jgi:hypothetical protein
MSGLQIERCGRAAAPDGVRSGGAYGCGQPHEHISRSGRSHKAAPVALGFGELSQGANELTVVEEGIILLEDVKPPLADRCLQEMRHCAGFAFLREWHCVPGAKRYAF